MGRGKAAALTVAALAIAGALAGCASSPSALHPTTTTGRPPTTTAPPETTSPATAPPATTSPPTTVAPTTTTTTQPPLGPGSHGPAVLSLQQRLTALGYWLGTPDGTFGDATEQAVYALQKAAGIERDGLVGPETLAALGAGVVPHPRPMSGRGIEVDLADDLLMFVTNGSLQWTLNTSTGGGYVYTGGALAVTPTGTFSIYREVDGLVVDNLGELWRPKFFDDGFAIHGDSYVPPYPVSHGCVRVSNEAIDWIWTSGLAPIGTPVWVYT